MSATSFLLAYLAVATSFLALWIAAVELGLARRRRRERRYLRRNTEQLITEAEHFLAVRAPRQH